MAKKNQQQGVVEPKETLNKSEAFFLQHKKPIIIAIIALFVIIAGLFLYKAYVSSPREDKASTAIARGQEYFNSEQFDKADETLCNASLKAIFISSLTNPSTRFVNNMI